MKLINFVPQKIRDRNAQKRIISASLIAAVIAGAAVVLLWLPMAAQVSANQIQLDASKAAASASVTKTVQDQTIITPDVSNRITQLNTVAKTEVNWPRAFAVVGDLLPKDTALSNFSYSNTQNVVTLKMAGTSPTNLSFATFLASLQKSKQFTGVKVDGYSYTPGKGVVDFSLSGQVPLNQIDYSTK